VRNEHDGLPRLPPDAQELDIHELARHGVERAEGLVHQEQRRVVDERAGDGHTLAHAARQLVRVLALEALEADQLEQRHRPHARGPSIESQHLGGQEDLGEHRPPRKEDRILEHDADVALGPSTGCPRTLTAPDERGMSPARIFMKVVLPQPDCPTMVMSSPVPTSREMPPSA
jgi:hypothetical protein